MSNNDVIMDLVKDVAGIQSDMKHVLKTLASIQETCKRNCERAVAPQESTITARLMIAVGAIASAASAVVIALISAVPPTISAITAWFHQKP